MCKSIRTLALMATLTGFVLAAPGSDPVTAAENPCKADIQKLCGDVQPGQGRIRECLKAHKDEISQECKDTLAAAAEKFKGKMEVAAEACKGDAQKLCPGVEPGEGRILKCLLEHKEELSEGCKNSLHK